MKQKNVTFIFESIECLILCSFLCIDLGFVSLPFGNEIKYTGIILCFFYVLFMYVFASSKKVYCYKEREQRCTVIAACLVCIADYFLLFTNQFFVGIVFFCMVQLTYYIRLNGVYLKRLYWSCIIALGLILLAACLGLVQSADVVVAICYGSLSIGNCIQALYHCKEKRFIVGIFCLLLCDSNVLIVNISNYMVGSVVPEFLIWMSGVFMWFFYLPSQVLIATSVPCDCNKND